MLGILNIKIPDMLSHKRCHGDSGILGCAEYELKMSNNDKKVSGRRLVRISFCSSCTSEALDAANGDGEIVSLMSVAWVFRELLSAGPSQNGTREAMVRFLRIAPLPL